jgi:hypothetical protein
MISDQVLERDNKLAVSRQRRTIGQGELRNSKDSTLRGNEPVVGRRSGRLRRPPKRFGQDM